MLNAILPPTYKWLRHRARLSQEKLGDELGASRTSIYYFERGDARPSPDIQDRAAHLSKGWELVAAPVALRFHRTFATFRQCTEFANGAVADLVEKHGLEPAMQIDGTEVTLILGIEAPPILSEGDFDFAQAIDPPSTPPDEPGLVHKPRKAA